MSTNQQLANAAYMTVIYSGQYNAITAMNVAFNMARKAHARSGRAGAGPTYNHIYRAANKYLNSLKKYI